MRYPGFVGPSNAALSLVADGEDLKNWYLERNPPGARSPFSLYPTDGVRLKVSVSNSAGRAHFAENGRAYALIGTGFYEYFQNGTSILRGTVLVNGNPGQVASNGDGGGEIAVASGGLLYIYDTLTHAFTNVAGVVADTVCFCNGFFSALNVATSTFRISDLFDGLTWDPTQFAQNALTSDRWKGHTLNGYNELWLQGESTTQVWVNTGAFPFPFAPRPNLVIPYGTAASFSAISFESTMLWMSQSQAGGGQLLESAGYAPQRVSNNTVEAAWRSYPRIDDLRMWFYQRDGHQFVVLDFPTADRSWVYDRTLGPDLGWARRDTFDSTTATSHRWRPTWHVEVWATHLVLDSASGNIYEMSPAFGLDVDALPIQRVRVGPPLANGTRLVKVKQFELIVESGLGTPTGAGLDPMIFMETSNNGGRTWHNGRARSAGKMGEHGLQQQWNRCGAGRSRSHRITYSDPTPLRVIDCLITLGRSSGAASRAA